jgi:PKD repeat protein
MNADHTLTAVFVEAVNGEDTQDPDAVAGSDQTVAPNTSCIFDGGQSSDNVGVVRYEWDFGDDTTGTGQVTTHTYATAGTYTVMLTVWDAAGNFDVDALAVTVQDAGLRVEWWMLALLFIGISAIAVYVARSR